VAKITILVSINQFNINTIKLINSHVNTPLINQYSIDDKSEGGDRWLLDRVLKNDWLRDEMVDMSLESQLRWKKKAV
jgi:hypothetical protein